MKFATVLVCMFLVGICHAVFIENDFDKCLQEKYSINTRWDLPGLLRGILPNPKPYRTCGCEPSKDKYCIAPYVCVNKSTPDDLLEKYKDCGVQATFKTTKSTKKEEPKDGQIGGHCELWRYCYGEARCENYKCVPHACKKEGETPEGPDDQCCMPMVTKKGEPCKLLNTDHNSFTCNSNRKCQLDHEGRDYVCCYIHGRENKPSCVLNHKCPRFRIYNENILGL